MARAGQARGRVPNGERGQRKGLAPVPSNAGAGSHWAPPHARPSPRDIIPHPVASGKQQHLRAHLSREAGCTLGAAAGSRGPWRNPPGARHALRPALSPALTWVGVMVQGASWRLPTLPASALGPDRSPREGTFLSLEGDGLSGSPGIEDNWHHCRRVLMPPVRAGAPRPGPWEPDRAGFRLLS